MGFSYSPETWESFTLSHNVFIPMFIGQHDEMRAIQEGKLILNPAADMETIQKLLAQIPSEYIGKKSWDAVKAGGLVNCAELLAKQVPLYPLPFKNKQFSKINKKYMQLGDTALIILYPNIFLQVVKAAVNMKYSNQYMTMIASAQYKKPKIDPYNCTIFNRTLSDRWKSEIILTVRMNPNLQIIDVSDASINKFKENMPLVMEEITDISVLCPNQMIYLWAS